MYSSSLTHVCLSGSGACILTALTIAAVDISCRHPADSHTFKSLVSQYIIATLMRIDGFYRYNSFMKACQNVASFQEETLMKHVITPNMDTEFGKKYDFKNIQSREDFRRNVPLSTYKDYIPYVQRIENNPGDVTGSLLFKAPVAFLAVTSGSTGANKTIPIANDIKRMCIFMKSLPAYLIFKLTGMHLRRQVRLGYRPLVENSPSGLQKAPISFHMRGNVPFSLIPNEVYQIQNEPTALYVEAVLALAEREVGCILGFMSTLVWAFWRVIDENWQQMCDDIERGRIHQNIHLEPSVRKAAESKY